MRNLTKNKWLRALVLVVACVLVGCGAEAKRARHMKRAEAYFSQKEYIKAEIEYRNVARLSKTLDPVLVARMATLFYEQGRIMEAFQALTNAVALWPDDLDLRYKLGTIWVTVRNYTNASEAALFVLAKNPGHHEAKLLLADAARSPEEVAAARQKVNEILKASGESWSAHVALAQLALREQNLDLAEKEVELAAKLDAKASPVILARAQLALLRKQPKEVERLLSSVLLSAPVRSPQRLLVAESRMQGTNLAEAKALVDAVLKEAPDYAPAWVLRGRIALAEKDYAECSRIVKNVLSWDPNNYDIRLLMARVLVLQDQPADGIVEFQRLEKMFPPPNPAAAELKYELAVAHVRNRAVDEALRKLDEAVRLSPDYAEAVILQAELKMRTGAAQEAVESLFAFAKRNPEPGKAFLLLARAYGGVGKLDEALAIYREFIRIGPLVPEFHFYAGTVLLQQKKLDEARLMFEQALKLAPAYLLAAEQIVDLDLDKKDFAAAQRRVDELLKLTTNAPGALMLQAKVCLVKGDWAGAESALTRVIKDSPDAMAPYSLLANVYVATGDPQKALTQLRSAVSKNPKDATALFLIGTIYESLKDYDKAKKSYEDALQINPKNPAALNNLAYLLSENLNQVDLALPYANKAYESAPDDPSVADTLGWISYRHGDFPRALTLLRESGEKMPKQAEVQYHLAMAQYTIGDAAAARASFARVTELDRSLSEAKRVSRRLAVLDLSIADPKAAEILEAALKEDSNDFLAAVKLGQVYERAGAHDKARSALERAAKIVPTSVEPLLLLASLNANKLNDVPKGLEAARAARKLAPTDAAIAGVLGRISYRANDYSAALALLQEFANSDKADAEALYDLALSYYSVGQFDEARANWGSYIKAGRGARLEDARNVIALMDFHAGKGDATQAAAIATARLQRDPNDLPGLMTLGLVAQQSAKFSDAAQKFERIASIDKLFPAAQRQLAILYGEHLQDDQKAYDYGSKARQTFPNDPELAIALGKTSFRRNDFPAAARLLKEGVGERQSDPAAFYYLGMAYHKTGKASDAKVELNRAITAGLDAKLTVEAKKVLATLN